MVDGGLRKIFRDKLRRGWHWQSIETGGTGRGIPDSNFCRDGVEGWVEFKKADAWAVDLRTEQVGWIKERRARGGRVFVAVRRKTRGGVRLGEPVDQLWLYSGDSVGELARRGLAETEPLGLWDGGPSGWNWEEVAELLLRS